MSALPRTSTPPFTLQTGDVVGLAKPRHDIHTLGLATVAELLRDCGVSTQVADESIENALVNPQLYPNFALLHCWLRKERITVLGISFRLDPDEAYAIITKLLYQLSAWNLLTAQGGHVRKVFFAGLPPAVEQLQRRFPELGVFYGDESPSETLARLGVDPEKGPEEIFFKDSYDEYLREFGRRVVDQGDYEAVKSVDRTGAKGFGTRSEKVVDRILHGRDAGLPPLMRAHLGPYAPNRQEAISLLRSWLSVLASDGLLDIPSLGTSQLTQERFGEIWGDAPNGGGIPVNHPHEYAELSEAARPMLMRTYAGTKNIAELARTHEATMNIAWHALSLWWFSELDGRGPYTVQKNLNEQFSAIKYIAETGKPLEPNIPHHFGFRGADDITYVVSAVLAARTFKQMGIRNFILQLMLNVPKQTSGINDLAKARAILYFLRKLEDRDFSFYVQPRAGLDFFSHNPEVAKAQLAHSTALMDDIMPADYSNPDIIHVVSYSEGYELASPLIVNESIRITRRALEIYRSEKRKGFSPLSSHEARLKERLVYLIEGADKILDTIAQLVSRPYTPEGLRKIFEMGFLPVPQLMYRRDEYPNAIRWQTKLRSGGVDVYEGKRRIAVDERLAYIRENVVPFLVRD